MKKLINKKINRIRFHCKCGGSFQTRFLKTFFDKGLGRVLILKHTTEPFKNSD